MKYALIDTANTFFRARHIASRNTDTWEKVGMALHLTLSSVNQVVRKFGIDHVVFCLEGRSWRKEFYKPYKALQQKLDIEYPQAEEYKRAYGLDKSHFDGKIYEIIKPVVDNIVYEIKRAILFFSKDNSNIKIKRAIITGGSVKLPDLSIYLVNTLGIEVVIGDCLKNMTFSPKIQNIKNMILDNQNQYSTAVGLAMKGIY